MGSLDADANSSIGRTRVATDSVWFGHLLEFLLITLNTCCASLVVVSGCIVTLFVGETGACCIQ